MSEGKIKVNEALTMAVYGRMQEQLEVGMHFKVIGMQQSNSKRDIWQISMVRVNTGGASKKEAER